MNRTFLGCRFQSIEFRVLLYLTSNQSAAIKYDFIVRNFIKKYSKTCVKRPLRMKVESISECSLNWLQNALLVWSILQYFCLAFSDIW